MILNLGEAQMQYIFFIIFAHRGVGESAPGFRSVQRTRLAETSRLYADPQWIRNFVKLVRDPVHWRKEVKMSRVLETREAHVKGERFKFWKFYAFAPIPRTERSQFNWSINFG